MAVLGGDVAAEEALAEAADDRQVLVGDVGGTKWDTTWSVFSAMTGLTFVGDQLLATAGPGAAASAADAFCTNVPAVTSANAMIT